MKATAFSLQKSVHSLLAVTVDWLKSGFSNRHWQQEMVPVPVRSQPHERVLANRQYRRK